MASDEQVAQISNDLKKLNKDSLIFLLINGKVPTGVSLNENVLKYIEEKWSSEDANLDDSIITVVDADENSQVCRKLSCITARYELKLANTEIKYLNQLYLQQKSSNDSLNKVINILQDDRYNEVRIHSKTKQTLSSVRPHTSNSGMAPPKERSAMMIQDSAEEQQSGSYVTATLSHNSPTTSADVISSRQAAVVPKPSGRHRDDSRSAVNGEVKTLQVIDKVGSSNQVGEWRSANKKKHSGARKIQTTVGTGANNSLKAAPVFYHFHVFRLDTSVNEIQLKNHLKRTFPEVTCTSLPSKYPEEYTSFKVGVHESNKERFLEPTLWPIGAKINKFFHFRKNQQEAK